jgi:hypothetical protein
MTWGGTTTTAWSTLIQNDIHRRGSGDYRGMRQGLPVTGEGSSDFTSVSMTNLSSTQVRDFSGDLISDSGSGIISVVQTSQWNSSGGGSITENFPGVPVTTSGPGYTTSSTSSSSRTLTLSESNGGSSSYSDVTILASINGSLQNVSRLVDETNSANSSSDSSTTLEGTSTYFVSAFTDYSNYDLNVTSDWIDRRSGSTSTEQSSFKRLNTNYAGGVTTSDSGSNSNFDSDSDVYATYTSDGTLTQRWLEWNEDNQDFEWHTYREVSNSRSNWFAEDESVANSTGANDELSSSGSSRGRTGDSFTSTTDRTTNGETETSTDSGSSEKSYETNTEEDIDQSDSDGTYGPYSGPPISPSPPDPRTSPAAAPNADDFDEDDSENEDLGNEETSSPSDRLSGRAINEILAELGFGATSSEQLDSLLADLEPAIASAIQNANSNAQPPDDSNTNEQSDSEDLAQVISDRFTPAALNQTISRLEAMAGNPKYLAYLGGNTAEDRAMNSPISKWDLRPIQDRLNDDEPKRDLSKLKLPLYKLPDPFEDGQPGIAIGIGPSIGGGLFGAGNAATALRNVPVSSAKIATELHHSLPKFLGGFVNQVLTKLSNPIHKEFHALLRENLKNAGIPLNVGGNGGSAADWARYMTANPDAQKKAFDAVLAASREIDMKYGTSIVQDVWRNLIGGNFTPYP